MRELHDPVDWGVKGSMSRLDAPQRRELRLPGPRSAAAPPEQPRMQNKGSFTVIAPHEARRDELRRQHKVENVIQILCFG